MKGRPARTGMWVLSSDGTIQSRDLRRHLDWLIATLQGRYIALQQLKEHHYSVDGICHWVQLGGTGGPTLSPANMRGLADLDLELGFEFWSEDEDEEENDTAEQVIALFTPSIRERSQVIDNDVSACGHASDSADAPPGF